MIDLRDKPVVLHKLLSNLGQKPDDEIRYEYYGYGCFDHAGSCKIKDLPRQISHYGKCFEVDANGVYKVDGAL